MVECARCSAEIVQSVFKRKYTIGGEEVGPFCGNCHRILRQCSSCGKLKELDFCKRVGSRLLCKECYNSPNRCDYCLKVCSDLEEIDGKSVCADCISERFTTCDCCNKRKLNDSFNYSSRNRAIYIRLFNSFNNICHECYVEQKLFVEPERVDECRRCGQFFPIKYSQSKEYCDTCFDKFSTCIVCKKKGPDVTKHTIDNSFNLEGIPLPEPESLHWAGICRSCFSSNRVFVCECGRYSKNKSKKRSLLGKLNRCTVCTTGEGPYKYECPICLGPSDTKIGCKSCKTKYLNNICSACGRVQDNSGYCRVCTSRKHRVYYYSEKFNPPYFHYTTEDKEEGTPIFFGFENEITVSNSHDSSYLYKVLAGLNKEYGPTFWMPKSDSSIEGLGFEFVTQPMTLRYFQKLNMHPMFNFRMIDSKKNGLHVHVNRESFLSDVHIYKVVDFVHQNVKWINLISGRDYNNYNGPLNHKPSKTVLDTKNKKREDRNVRVNLTNRNTVEFRMFASCVREFTLRYRVEFVHALVSFTKMAGINSNKWEVFEDFVMRNGKDYYHLVKFIQKVGGSI